MYENRRLFGHFFFFGDEGKSKVVASLVKREGYTHVLRFNGSSNAGHTWYFNGKKIISHMIPTGIPYGITGVIGPGCVLNVEDFFKELNELEEISPGCSSRVKVAYNTHIVTQSHRSEEVSETKIGTTRKGVGPAYRDKHARTGIRAESIPELKPFLTDTLEEFSNPEVKVLAEGAQAIGLDIDWSPQYPYCTSSNCGIGAVINNGVRLKSIRDVYGVVKAYNTYVGSVDFQDKTDPILDVIGDIGMEYGATTGRRRKVAYFDTNMYIRGCDMNSVNKVIVNKMDVLQKANVWRVIDKNSKILDLESEQSFKDYVCRLLPEVEVTFSYSPEDI